jgi:mono/diheme cytochrome c family protein
MQSRYGVAFLVAASLMGLAACRHEEPRVIYMPDMVYSPALKAQEVGSVRMPVAGTVSREHVAYNYTDVNQAGRELANPLRPTRAVLARGQAVYNTYCIVCHGPNGEGDGYVVPKYPRPPTLQSDKVRQYPDGSIYHVISLGQNLMPSYASQIAPADRWAITHYIRVLQRAKHPSAADLKEVQDPQASER